MNLPTPVDNLIILTQIGVFSFTGIIAVILENTVRSWILASSSFLYGTTLYLLAFADAELRGWPSLFLLVFMVTMLSSGLRDRLRASVRDEH